MKPSLEAPATLRERAAWLPPFLVAFAGATTGEMATGLLLYSSEGFLRALTAVLVTELGALGVGFHFSRRLSSWDMVGLRRRWLLAVFAFGAAAVFAGGWGLTEGFSATPLSQGLGLALLAGLPLFSVGAVLGALPALASPPELRSARRGDPARLGDGRDLGHGGVAGTTVAAPASFGAAAGLLFTGFYGVPSLQPASLLLFCVVLVSVGALLHGWIVDRSVRVRPLRSFTPAGGLRELRMERWTRISPWTDLRVFRAGKEVVDVRHLERGTGRPERDEDRTGLPGTPTAPCIPWQRQVLDLVREEADRRPDGGLEILLVGVGTGALLACLEASVESRVRALEPAAPEGTFEDAEGADRKRVPTPTRFGGGTGGRGADATPPGAYDVVVVNLRLLPRSGPLGGPGLGMLEEVLAARKRSGVLLLGGLRLEDEGAVRSTLAWVSERCGGDPSLFRPEAGAWGWDKAPWKDLVPALDDLGGGLVVCRPRSDPADAPPGGSMESDP